MPITNWLEHDDPVYQFNAQRIPKIEVHVFEECGRKVNDDISAAIAGVLALHGCRHGFTHYVQARLG